MASKNYKTLDMEIAVANHFGIRTNVIVPNISWGMFNHECDLLVLTQAGYGYEIEIKVDKYDLIKDKDKCHGHYSNRIKYLYFAIPKYLKAYIEHIPERAGIIIVEKYIPKYCSTTECYHCEVIRKPIMNNKYKFSDAEKFQIVRLGAMRVWSYKLNIVRNRNMNI